MEHISLEVNVSVTGMSTLKTSAGAGGMEWDSMPSYMLIGKVSFFYFPLHIF